jgi:lipid II:glycine glycyltransferase (peptidoglycan interpeptide bridge formation enzyme)
MRSFEPVPIPFEQLEGDRLLQSRFWARLKGAYGWKAFAFQTGADEGRTLLLLYRRFSPGIAIGYVPHGAGSDGSVSEENVEELKRLSTSLKKHLPSNTILIRWDLARDTPGDFASSSALSGAFTKAPVDIQPPDTVVIDLDQDEDELLSAMKTKTRYNIRLAFRKGLEVSSEGAGGLDSWYRLYRETAERDRIAIHPESYYRKLFRLAEEHPEDGLELELLMARSDGEAIAGIITARFAGTATYLYGASGNRKRNLMPAYALQWKAMEAARKAGCTRYDLFGIPPADDPSHPMHGLYRFKTGFGGEIVHRPGCWDHTLRPLRAGAYRSLEKVRRWYFLEYRKHKKR